MNAFQIIKEKRKSC